MDRLANRGLARTESAAISVVMAAVMVAVVIAAIIISSAITAALPAAAAQFPAAWALAPFRAAVHIAAASTFPMAAGPDVTTAGPVPVARSPDIAIAWRRHWFISWRWRRYANGDAHADLRHGLRWSEGCSGAGGDEYSRAENTFHILFSVLFDWWHELYMALPLCQTKMQSITFLWRCLLIVGCGARVC